MVTFKYVFVVSDKVSAKSKVLLDICQNLNLFFVWSKTFLQVFATKLLRCQW